MRVGEVRGEGGRMIGNGRSKWWGWKGDWYKDRRMIGIRGT